MMKNMRGFWRAGLLLVALLVVGQAASFLLAPASWKAFLDRLGVILSMIAFWGPILALFSGLFVWGMLRMLGFTSLEEIRQESVEQNNPTPAIIFVGTLIASMLFFMLVIRP
jgi:Na+-transporting NADH:ubiquinone oxidoreductase subunit NqrD